MPDERQPKFVSQSTALTHGRDETSLDVVPLRLRDLQNHIRKFDCDKTRPHHYFLKLIEEIGEVSETIYTNSRMGADKAIKGTLEEELYDVLYYIVALANIYDIDLEECHQLKESINAQKYGRKTQMGSD